MRVLIKLKEILKITLILTFLAAVTVGCNNYNSSVSDDNEVAEEAAVSDADTSKEPELKSDDSDDENKEMEEAESKDDDTSDEGNEKE